MDVSPLPDESEVEFYATHGWYVSRIILTAPVLDAALAGVERFYRGERDWEIPEEATSFDWKAGHGGGLRTNAYLSLRIREVRALVRQRIIAAIAGRLCGTNHIRLFRDVLLYKPSERTGGSNRVGWHTDRSYWPTCTSSEMLTAWVPFADCDRRHGTLSVVEGSHVWPQSDQWRYFKAQDLGAIESTWHRLGLRGRKRVLCLRRGQVSFHHCRLLHASGPNHSRKPRISLAIHLQDAANRYKRAYGPEGRPLQHSNDFLCRRTTTGEPNYSDGRVCPILWRAKR